MLNFDFFWYLDWSQHFDVKVILRKCGRRQHALWLTKGAMKERSSRFWEYKSFFKKSISDSNAALLSSGCLRAHYLGFDVSFFIYFLSCLCIPLKGELKNTTWMRKSGERGFFDGKRKRSHWKPFYTFL